MDLLKEITVAAFKSGIALSTAFSYHRARHGHYFQHFIRSWRPPDDQEVTKTVLNYLSS